MTLCMHNVPFEVTCAACVSEAMDKEAARKPKLIKAKKCCICKETFVPRRAMQSACSYPATCEAIKAERLVEKEMARREKVARRQVAERKEAIMTLPARKKITERSVNAFILARDAGLPCISCGSITGKPQAGHYLSVGSRPGLRYTEFNIHLQCYRCNCELGGNAIMYRIGLVKKIGLEAVETLENDDVPRHYSKDDLIAMAAHYRKLARELKA